jgi:hypothetical protein
MPRASGIGAVTKRIVLLTVCAIHYYFYYLQQQQLFFSGLSMHLLQILGSFSDGFTPNIFEAIISYRNPSSGTPHLLHFFVISPPFSISSGGPCERKFSVFLSPLNFPSQRNYLYVRKFTLCITCVQIISPVIPAKAGIHVRGKLCSGIYISNSRFFKTVLKGMPLAPLRIA